MDSALRHPRKTAKEKYDPSSERLEQYKKLHNRKSGLPAYKKKNIYKDPIFGVAHNHEPTVHVLIDKRDPFKQMNQSLKEMTQKSQLRLKRSQCSKPRFQRNRLDLSILTNSPLMCFPHFIEMTKNLIEWHEENDNKKDDLASRGLCQRAAFNAASKFYKTLFLLLQEATRATPLSPAPLAGIYRWFLNRDITIKQSKQIDIQSQDLPYIIIELPYGEEVHVEKRLLDFNQVFPKDAFSPENLQAVFDRTPVFKEEEEVFREEETIKESNAVILRDGDCSPIPKKNANGFIPFTRDDNEFIHHFLKRSRDEDKEADQILAKLRNGRYKV